MLKVRLNLLLLILMTFSLFGCIRAQPSGKYGSELQILSDTAGSEIIDGVIRVEPPANWTRRVYTAFTTDPAVIFEKKDSYGIAITVYVFGGPGSFFQSPAEYMNSYYANPGKYASTVFAEETVAGHLVKLYQNRVSEWYNDEHAGRILFQEFIVYCVLPPLPDGRFFVLYYSQPSIFGFDENGETAWKALLKSVRLIQPEPRLKSTE